VHEPAAKEFRLDSIIRFQEFRLDSIQDSTRKSLTGVQDLEVEFDLGSRHRSECHKLPFCERLRRDNVSMICSKNEKGGPGSLKVFMHGFESI